MSTFSIHVEAAGVVAPAKVTDDHWRAQEIAANEVSDRLYTHYQGGDWTGRKATTAALLDQAFNLPESGGEVGPLPDGSKIIVAVVA